MAKSKIPDPMSRRHLIEKEMDPGAALAIAEAYLEAERCDEALAFLVKAEASDRIAEMRGHGRGIVGIQIGVAGLDGEVDAARHGEAGALHVVDQDGDLDAVRGRAAGPPRPGACFLHRPPF